MFKTSCFGQFLGMVDLKFYVQIVHNMLLRQCDITKEDELWILVHSKGLRFSVLEFALITYLSFGNILQSNSTSLRIRFIMTYWRRFSSHYMRNERKRVQREQKKKGKFK